MGRYATLLVTKSFPPYPLPREAEDLPSSAKYFKHVPLLT